MNFLIAVLFVCSSDQCTFMQGEKKHFDKPSCEQDVAQALADLRSSGLVAQGTCIALTTRDLL
jgi:hypothetical protein